MSWLSFCRSNYRDHHLFAFNGVCLGGAYDPDNLASQADLTDRNGVALINPDESLQIPRRSEL
jgi:hypothetical protein